MSQAADVQVRPATPWFPWELPLGTLQLFGLWALNCAGVWVVQKVTLPLPGNLVGMVLLYALLALGIVKLSWFEAAGSLLVRHLAFFFVPITVGLMDAGSLFAAYGIGIILTLAASAAIGIMLAGWFPSSFSANPDTREAHHGCRFCSRPNGFGIALTAGAYSLSLLARKRYPSPLTTPVLFSTAVVIAVLMATGISFADYQPAKNIMTFLLGPATVALAIPLYKNRQTFFRNLVPAGVRPLAGSLGTMIAAGLMARVFKFTPELVSSIAIKSATVPIAVEVAKIVHGNPTLTAVLVVLTGMIGASFGPWLMDRLAITDPLSRGLALGTISHGQGTAQAATESELSGAIAGVAMGLGAVCTSLAAPWIVPLLA